MPLFVPMILAVWLLVVAVALLLCIGARRMDEQLSRAELAPVIDLTAALRSGRHIA
jgi:hypothetical protein